MFDINSLQYIPEILDFIKPLNVSRPRILLHQIEYFDQEKCFYIVIIHEFITIFFFSTTGIAAETFSLANAIHAFGMFKIARYIVSEKISY